MVYNLRPCLCNTNVYALLLECDYYIILLTYFTDIVPQMIDHCCSFFEFHELHFSIILKYHPHI